MTRARSFEVSATPTKVAPNVLPAGAYLVCFNSHWGDCHPIADVIKYFLHLFLKGRSFDLVIDDVIAVEAENTSP